MSPTRVRGKRGFAMKRFSACFAEKWTAALFVLIPVFLAGAPSRATSHGSLGPKYIPRDAFVFECGDPDTRKAYHLALDVVRSNIKPWKRGLLTKEAPVLFAGGGYGRPWTRDSSYNTFFALGLLSPPVARNTLLSVLTGSRRDGSLRIGGQYWDSVSWALGARTLYSVTGDQDFLAVAYQAITNSLRYFRKTEFDPATGLFCGPGWSDGIAGYPAPYDKAGGSSFILDYVRANPGIDKIRMKALSTNALYYNAYMTAFRLGAMKGAPKAVLSDLKLKAKALRAAINRKLWLEDAGHYGYFLDRNEKIDRSMEALGHAFVILFRIAPPKRAKRIFSTQYVSPHGIPCVWPLFPRFSRDTPGRHCGTVWPQIQGFWALAAASKRKVQIMDKELRALTKCALKSGDFREIYHPFTGEPYGGIQTGRLGRVSIRNLRYRKMTLDIFLNGKGATVTEFKVDGREQESFFLPASLTGSHKVEITLSE